MGVFHTEWEYMSENWTGPEKIQQIKFPLSVCFPGSRLFFLLASSLLPVRFGSEVYKRRLHTSLHYSGQGVGASQVQILAGREGSMALLPNVWMQARPSVGSAIWSWNDTSRNDLLKSVLWVTDIFHKIQALKLVGLHSVEQMICP